MKAEYKIRKLEYKMALDAGALERGVKGKGQEKWASVLEKATTLKHIRGMLFYVLIESRMTQC